MARIVVEGFYGETELFPSQYEGLRSELEAAGHHVVIERPLEQKSLGGVAQDVALHVLSNLDAYVEAAIMAATARWLRGKARIGPRRGGARRATLYGPKGEVLKSWDLPEHE